MIIPTMQPRRSTSEDGAAPLPEDDDVLAATSRPVVLVVEDDEGLREAMNNVLRDEGYDVELAANGHEAINALDSGLVPSLIVLDLRMPLITGWGVWDHLQLSPTLKTVPVLVFTGTGLSQGSVGAAKVLAKSAGLE